LDETRIIFDEFFNDSRKFKIVDIFSLLILLLNSNRNWLLFEVSRQSEKNYF